MFISSPLASAFGWLDVESSVVVGSGAVSLSDFLLPEKARVVCFLGASFEFEFEPKNLLNIAKQVVSTWTTVTIEPPRIYGPGDAPESQLGILNIPQCSLLSAFRFRHLESRKYRRKAIAVSKRYLGSLLIDPQTSSIGRRSYGNQTQWSWSTPDSRDRSIGDRSPEDAGKGHERRNTRPPLQKQKA